MATVPIFGGFSTVDVHSKLDVQGSIRGRLGFAWDRVLIYATGGVAFGGINTDITVFGTDFFGTPVFGSGNRSTTRVGWTVGGGLEYALTNNWSVRAEYRFTDFGRINQTGIFEDTNPLILTPTAAFIGNRRIQENQVQVGVDYKFDLFDSPAGRCEILSRSCLASILSKRTKNPASRPGFCGAGRCPCA